ncbi:MAG: protein kinase [bacterium]
MADLRTQLQTSLGSAYIVERELGGGGMSRVFVAEETALCRRVVVKVLPDELSGNVSIARFRREVSLAARLQHPHIVPVLSTGEVDGQPYYIMPFVDGESLRAKVAHGELSVPATISILRDVARALECAHAKGVAHRDIKPDNILLAGTTAVITDFGIAKALSEAVIGEPLTSIGVSLGTPAYMAPEQAAADPSTDLRADIYAFGVVAYEMLAGHTPFSGRGTQATMAAHATETPPGIVGLRPTTPPVLAELVMRCLEKRPGDRPQNASELVQSLESIAMTTQPTAAPRASGAGSENARRTRWIAGGAIVVAAAAVVAFALSRSGPPTERDARSIAVLPFENARGDSSFAYLADGISDELRSAITVGFPELSVRARSSSERFRGRNVSVRDIGAKLSVGMVMQGAFRRSGDRMRMTADLVSVTDESALWSGAVDVPITDARAALDSLFRGVSVAFRARLATRSPATVSPRPRETNDVAAYDEFLRGLYAFDKFDFPRSAEYFRAATVRDPTFARAHGYLAMMYANLPIVGTGPLDSLLALARASADRALALDSNLVQAYVAQSIALADEMRFGEAMKPMERAVAIDPNDADVLENYGFALVQVGRVSEAVVQNRRARDRDPLSANTVGMLSYVLSVAHETGEAIAAGRESVFLDPINVLGREALGYAYAYAGQRDSSVAAFESTFRVDSTIFGRASLVFAYAVAGRWDDAARERKLVGKERGSTSPNYHQMLVELAYGEIAPAMTSVERGVAGREPLYSIVSVACDPLFDPLKSDPRFSRLMARIGAKACPASGAWPIKPRPG